MRTVIPIPFDFNRKTFDSWIKLERYSDITEELNLLLEECLPLIKPIAIIKEAHVDSVEKNCSVIEGVTFKSSVLAWNLSRTDRVWAHIMSCGREIYERLLQEEDPLKQYWIDALAELAVQNASEYLMNYMTRYFQKEGQGTLSYMNPGSADRDVWDLSDQKLLFDLIGNVEKEIGVTLTEGNLMEPSKSLSGLYFQSKEGFVACWVCSQNHCHSRKAAMRKDYKNFLTCI